jgi:ABC-type Fe3+-hydroxamate transport system substrate-binding protein
VANQEENSPVGIEALQRAGIPVWLTFPLTVVEALADLQNLAALFENVQAQEQAARLGAQFEQACLSYENKDRRRVFCPIWQDGASPNRRWWMTFNQQTYPNDLLESLGGENVFRSRVRRYPLAADLGEHEPEDAGERDTRYPRVRLDEVLIEDPDMVLLPDEPYEFSMDDAVTLKHELESHLDHQVQVERVDGSLLFWPGTRLGKALERLALIFPD